eukprot:1794891-Rhodomonas_salina.4
MPGTDVPHGVPSNPCYPPTRCPVLTWCTRYGKTADEWEGPIPEHAPLQPVTPYGVSKVAQVTSRVRLGHVASCGQAAVFDPVTYAPRSRHALHAYAPRSRMSVHVRSCRSR